ncbi:MAG: family transcriptional regulator [Clostridia bacterium]|jgi:glucokinase-like ROK family protein|nr:family transcriptional regulator [Clostridia bacterium]
MKVLAVDIGGTALKIAETTHEGIIISSYEEPTEAKKGGTYIIDKVCRLIKGYKGYDCIGISTAGQVDSRAGTIIFANANIPDYTGMKVKAIISECFGVPVAVENDVNAAALGEAFYGAGKNEKDFLCLTYGTGIGGAIVIDRRIYKGHGGLAGEFGHILLHPEGKNCGCGQKGCYEQYASVTALVSEAKRIDSEYNNGRIIFEQLHKGNMDIKKVVDAWIDEVMIGLASLTHIFNPKCFILGGGVLEEEYIVKQINRKFSCYIMPSYRGVIIEKAKLGNKAGVLGATYIACQELKGSC